MYYLLILISGMFVLYFILPHIFSIFSKEKPAGKASMFSLLIIALWMIFIYFATGEVQDIQLANRLLHSLGGGVSMVLIAYLVLRDYKIQIDLKQSIVLIFLLAGFFGIANEIIEFLLQETTNLIFASTAVDTWLDLVSNLIGTIVGLAIFSVVVSKRKLS